MPKFQLLLLDAGIVIELHKLGLWSQIVEKCSVHLTEEVIQEADFWPETDESGTENHYVLHKIDLNPLVKSGKIQKIEVSTAVVKQFMEKFNPSYLDRLDPGESESLAFLFTESENWLISSGDAIVYRVLGRMGCSYQGISLEEILENIGLGRKDLAWKLTRKFREVYTKRGEQDSITGLGMK
jgi:hypothetical protein